MSNEPHVVLIELPIKYVLRLKNSIESDLRGHSKFFEDVFLSIMLAAHRRVPPATPKHIYNRLERVLILAIYLDYLASLKELGNGKLESYVPVHHSDDVVALFNLSAINKEL